VSGTLDPSSLAEPSCGKPIFDALPRCMDTICPWPDSIQARVPVMCEPSPEALHALTTSNIPPTVSAGAIRLFHHGFLRCSSVRRRVHQASKKNFGSLAQEPAISHPSYAVGQLFPVPTAITWPTRAPPNFTKKRFGATGSHCHPRRGFTRACPAPNVARVVKLYLARRQVGVTP